MEIYQFILECRYVWLFGAAMIYSEPVVISMSFLCRSLGFSLLFVFVLSFIGTLLSSTLCFFIGQLFRERLCGFKNSNAAFNKVNFLIERYSIWFIVFFRFIYGVKLVSPIVLGISNISTKSFLINNCYGAILWSGIMSFLGACLSLYFEELTVNLFFIIYISTVATPFVILFLIKFLKLDKFF